MSAISDVMNGDNSLRQSEAAIDELLSVFLAKAEPVTRKLADEVYERFLYSVQDYLRDNAAWNLASEIDRCRRVEAENRTLSETVRVQAEEIRQLKIGLDFAEKLYGSETLEQIVTERADWLLDAIAGATQDRQFLRGEEECNPVICDAVLLNGAKAIRTAIGRAQAERMRMAREEVV